MDDCAELSSELVALKDREPIYAHLKSNRSKAAVHGAFWSALNSIIPTLLSSAVFIVSSRYLLPQDFGIIALAISIVTLASAIAPAAFGEALIQQQNILKTHLDTVFWLCTGSALLIYALLLGFSSIIVHATGQEAIAVFLPVLGLKLFFDLSAVVPNALIARSMSFHLIALRTTVATALSSAVCIGLLLAGYGMWALAVSQIAVSMVSCIAAFWGGKWLPSFRVNLREMRSLAHYGLFASGNRFLQLMNLDQIIIGSLIGPAPLGIFNFAKRLYQMINDVISGGLTSVSHVLFSSLQEDTVKVREAFLLTTFGCSLVAFPAFIGLAAVADDAIPLIFGTHWVDAIWPTRGFCVIGLMSCIGVIQASLITSQGKSNWWFYYQLFRQLLTIITIIVLYKQGVTYIVLAMVIQVLLFWPITLVMVSKIINLKIKQYLGQFLPPLISCIALAMTVFAVRFGLKDMHMALRLIAEMAAGGLAYALVIFVLSRDHILAIAQTILRRGRR